MIDSIESSFVGFAWKYSSELKQYIQKCPMQYCYKWCKENKEEQNSEYSFMSADKYHLGQLQTISSF